MAEPISGTLADTYLRRRGITLLSGTAALRYYPRCYYRPDEHGPTEIRPAMIAAVTDLAGRQTGAHRTWLAQDGSERCYRSTDNLVDPSWRGRPADDVINAVRSAGLELDPRSGVGAILHMLIGLDIDGRIGLTTIGRSPGHAERLHRAAVVAIATSASHRRS